MKNLTLFLALLLGTQLIFAQATEGINYQAVLRDGNTILANTTVSVLLAIEDANAAILYEENHASLTTDEFGLLNFVIGEGTPVIGTFDGVDWSQPGLQYESEVTFNGTIFSLGRIELQSVPYALYADLADSATTAGSATTLALAGGDPGDLLVWDGTNWVVNSGTTVDGDEITANVIQGPNWLVTDSLNGRFLTFGANGNLNFQAGLGQSPDLGFAGASDNQGVTKSFIDVLANNTGRFEARSAADGLNVFAGFNFFSSDVERGLVTTDNADGLSSVIVSSAGFGSGAVETYGDNGSVNVLLTSVNGLSDAGVVSVSDSSGNTGWITLAGIPNRPSYSIMEMYGENGNVNLTTFNFDDNLGFLALGDSAGNGQVIAEVTTDGDGAIALFGPNGNANIEMNGFALDENIGSMEFSNTDGDRRVSINAGQGGTGTSDQGFIATYGPTGDELMQIGGDFNGEAGFILMLDTAQNFLAELGARSGANSPGQLVTRSPNGNNNINTVIGALFDEDLGYIAVADSSSMPRVSMNGVGEIFSDGPNGNTNVRISGGFTTNTLNNGLIEVYDDAGAGQAGIFVDASGDGIVFGDLKNFRIPHPKQPGKEIWYASLEGPEAAAYVRGTAQLINGEALVTFPEHFTAIASEQGMTVVLTPLSADSEGMAVIEKTTSGFRVKELHQGVGTYEFDWEVKCVRSGYETYRTVRDASEYQAPARAKVGELPITSNGLLQTTDKATTKRTAPKAKSHKNVINAASQQD